MASAFVAATYDRQNRSHRRRATQSAWFWSSFDTRLLEFHSGTNWMPSAANAGSTAREAVPESVPVPGENRKGLAGSGHESVPIDDA